jgi:tripartite-type tricarboxylate transporter receptor subunit TctC
MEETMKTGFIGIALAIPVAVSALAAPASGAEEFYKGKTVKVIVGYAPGGAYDRSSP